MKDVAYMTNRIFDNSPTPNQTMNKVTSAIAGMNRRKWMNGSTMRLAVRKLPTIRPMGMAIRLPSTQPVRMRAMLTPICTNSKSF